MSEPSTSPLYSAAQLTEMLSGILHSVDNNERRSIEAAVVRSLATSANLVQLVNVLCGNLGADAASVAAGQPSAGVRQLAAVLLRKKIFSLWNSLDAPQQQQLRGLLLAQLGSEPVRIVRFAIAHIVTRLAKADVANLDENGSDTSTAAWPELQQAIRAAVEDPRAEMRELSMVLVYSVAEVFSEENAFSGLAAESVLRGLADSDATVQSAAVKAAMMLLPSLAANARVYVPFLQQLVPQCVSVLEQHATVKDDSKRTALCVNVLDLIEQLLGDLSAKKNGDVIALVVHKLLEVLGQRETNARVRQNCGTTLCTLIAAKPKFVVSHGLLAPMMHCCVTLMAEDATISLPDEEMMEEGEGSDADGDGGANDKDDDDDDVDMLHVHPVCRIGVLVLIGLANAVANKAFAAVLMPFVTAVTEGKPFAGVEVQDPLVRKSAILALACLAEGNPNYLRRRVSFVLQVVQSYFQDGHPVVRESAAFALSAFCLYLQPEILTRHAELFPMLVPLLADPNNLVRCRAADALDTLCENVAEELEPYVAVVLPAVMAAIGSSSLSTQKALCGVISSIGMTRCPSIHTFAPSVMELLKQPFAVPPTPETIPLRAQATETAGIMGVAMGKDAFAPYFPVFMHHIVVENFALGSAALREQSFGFLSNVCEVLREDFAPFLDDAITEALRTVEEDTAVFTNKHLLAKVAMPLALEDDMKAMDAAQKRAASGRPGGGGGEDDDEDDDDEDDDDEAAEMRMRVRTADIEEKCSAINAIGVFAETLLTHFGLARVQRCMEPLAALEGHYYPNVRSNMMLASAKLVKAAHGKPTVEKSLTADTLEEAPRDMLDDLIHQTILRTMHEDVEKEVVAAACEAMQILLDFFGPQCFPFGPDVIAKECILFLRQRTSCQLAVDFDAEDSDQDDVDGEDALFREADDLIASNHHASWRDVVQPDMVLRGVRLAEDHDDVVMDYASDMLDSLSKAYGPAFAPYAPYLMPLLLKYCDPHTRDASDLTMGIGSLAVLLQSLGPAVAATYFDAAVAVSFAILHASDESTARGNSCYLLRILIESCPSRFAGDVAALQQTLQALWSVAAAGEGDGSAASFASPSAAAAGAETPGAVDNAISATCSLVRCCSFVPTAAVTAAAAADEAAVLSSSQPSALFPMWPTVVPPMLQGIPMRLEKEENGNAVETLVFLLSHPSASTATAAAAWLPALVRSVASVFASRTVEAKEKDALLAQGVVVFVQANGQAWQAARHAAQLNAEQEAAMSQAGY